MSTTDTPVPAPSAPPTQFACANCGHELAASYCANCGQHRRGSERLKVREVVARSCEHVFDFDSAFLGTFVGLFRRPGEVCREYVQGRRKRYMNPFAYFILSGTVGLLVSAFVGWLTEAPVAPEEEFIADHGLWILLAMLVPLAVTWWKLFAQSGYNLAENYVFALYVLAQFTWLETLVLLPLTSVASDVVLVIGYLAAWLAYVTYAATPFYGEPALIVGLKVVASLLAFVAIVALAVCPVGIIMYFLFPSE